jgi:hypothetical protein
MNNSSRLKKPLRILIRILVLGRALSSLAQEIHCSEQRDRSSVVLYVRSTGVLLFLLMGPGQFIPGKIPVRKVTLILSTRRLNSIIRIMGVTFFCHPYGRIDISTWIRNWSREIL